MLNDLAILLDNIVRRKLRERCQMSGGETELAEVVDFDLEFAVDSNRKFGVELGIVR